MTTSSMTEIGDTILPPLPLTRSYIHTSSPETLLYMTVGQLLDEACEECPDHEAFVICDTEERLTFAEVQKRAKEYAKGFLSIGLKKGDVICLAGVTNSDWLFVYFAAAYIGLVLIAATTVKEADFDYGSFAAKAQARLVIVGPWDDNVVCENVCNVVFEGGMKYGHNADFIYCQSGRFEIADIVKERKLESLKKLVEVGKTVTEEDFQAAMNEVIPEDPYVLMPTSGTTGLPKLVAWNQGWVCNFGKFNMRSKIPGKEATKQNPGVVGTFSALGDPTNGMSCIGIGTYYKDRVRIVFLSDDLRKETCDVEETALKILVEERCTFCVLWPPFYIDLIKAPNFEKYDLTRLKGGFLGGQRCSPELFDKLFRIFPELIHTYGGSEAGLVSCTSSDYPDRETRVETVGHPAPYYQVKIADDNGQVLPVNTPGEICCKGWAMFHSYWKEPELTARAFRDGWYLTGDIGTLDSSGLLRIIGRKADAIRFNRYGFNVYPAPIETVLHAHPKVKSAQVVGIHDDYIGDRIIACIILNDNELVDEKELKEHCETNLTLELWVPDKFVFMTEFPKVGVRNKVCKRKIRELVRNMLSCEKESSF